MKYGTVMQVPCIIGTSARPHCTWKASYHLSGVCSFVLQLIHLVGALQLVVSCCEPLVPLLTLVR